MKWSFITAAATLAACTSVAHASDAVASPAAQSLQAVVVSTAEWTSKVGSLQCYERRSASADWEFTGLSFPVVTGRNGLAWGAGLHRTNGRSGLKKREGDGCAPAGVFRLSGAFGYESPASAPWLRMPYVQCTSALKCVDDTNSSHYNTLVSTAAVSQTWASHEEMRRTDDLYRLGIFVDHNAEPRRQGGGSCIFIHAWSNPESDTSGCTATSLENVTKLLHWLTATSNPVLIQLPESEYVRLEKQWRLPSKAAPPKRGTSLTR